MNRKQRIKRLKSSINTSEISSSYPTSKSMLGGDGSSPSYTHKYEGHDMGLVISRDSTSTSKRPQSLFTNEITGSVAVIFTSVSDFPKPTSDSIILGVYVKDVFYSATELSELWEVGAVQSNPTLNLKEGLLLNLLCILSRSEVELVASEFEVSELEVSE